MYRFSARFMSDGSLNMMCKISCCTIRNETLSLLAMCGVKKVPLAVYIVRAEKKMSRAEDTNHYKKKIENLL